VLAISVRKKTILDLRDSPWVDGPGRTILECAEDIDDAKFRIVVGAFDSRQPEGTLYEQEARRRGLDVVRIHERRSADLGVLKQILSFVCSQEIDLIHTHDFRSNLYGRIAAKLTRKKVVATVHGWITNDSKAHVKKKIDKLLLRFADHVIAVSNNTLSLLGNSIPTSRCTIIPNALRIENYCPIRPLGKFRKEFTIEEGDVLIANIGRLSPEKGQRLFLEAAREIAKKTSGIRFVLFGIGPDQNNLEAMVNGSGLNDVVLFAGYRNDMNTIYNDIDLVVQTSYTEGMPNVILESLLMEVPVVATNVGGTREIVRDGETGVLIPEGDLRALLHNISEFLRDPGPYKEMAKIGRRDVASRFNHRDRVRSIGEIYEALADGS
jgi:glycosyltransferase involved in cell wall biosynthesis